jgi:hypothetical protein
VVLVVNWVKCVLLTFMESKFTLNHSFIQLKAAVILMWKLFMFGLVTYILVSSANSLGVFLSFIVLVKSYV